ncbi:MAG: hypothetical protein H6830_04550 [Planctomycetes bacterium]|nr:hypothetical protein [Planctomycetota bacterium]MCB9910514.1 hypothetical protein [Planctomycetota bacterium]MCB9912640.1 hypothetical protein [Planctomycetota bacterium]HRV80847.1 hypothetical protein [Planctomycetota bacterium]
MTLEALTDYVKSTEYSPFPDRKKFINLATRNSYLLAWLLGSDGGENSSRFQGGKGIRHFLMPDEKSTAEWTVPGIQLNLSNPQVLADHTQDWRFLVDHMTISDPEAELNEGAPIAEQLIDIMEPKEERLATSMVHAWEDSLGAIPNFANMEASNGAKRPMSIFSFVTEEVGVAPMWGGTTVMGLDPTVIDKWDNTRSGYSRLNSDQAGAGYTVQNALSRAARLSKFRTLPVSMLANRDRQETMIAKAWFTSLWGIEVYEDAVLKHSHDPLLMATMQDLGVDNPGHKGVPLVWWERMDEAALYVAGAGYGTEQTADVKGPRYMGVDRDTLFPILHKKKYFEKGNAMRIHDQPMDAVTWRSLWCNLGCTDRRRQALVYPTVTQTVPG